MCCYGPRKIISNQASNGMLRAFLACIKNRPFAVLLSREPTTKSCIRLGGCLHSIHWGSVQCYGASIQEKSFTCKERAISTGTLTSKDYWCVTDCPDVTSGTIVKNQNQQTVVQRSSGKETAKAILIG